MSLIVMEIPDGSLDALHLPPEGLAGELRLAAAVKLYELGRLSSGAAAQLAGLPRVGFLQRLSDYGVDSFCLTEGELNQETRLG